MLLIGDGLNMRKWRAEIGVRSANRVVQFCVQFCGKRPFLNLVRFTVKEFYGYLARSFSMACKLYIVELALMKDRIRIAITRLLM